MLPNWTVIRLLGAHGAGGDGGGPRKVHPEDMEGFNRWLWDSSDDHRVLFALGTVVVLLTAGVVIGLLAEVILTKLGLGTKAIENHE